MAVVIAYLVDRIVLARGGRLAGQVTDVGVSRAAATRLRVVRRLVFVTIVVVGIGLALSQFTKLEKLATGLLASSAVLGIVLGLAARQVLANPLAGILLAITQPIRIGDTITLDDQTGRVDDLTLSYTYIDTGDGRLMIVPNEQVVTHTVFNRSTGDQNAPVAASVWLPRDGDIEKARAALAPLEASEIETVEITPDGVRLEVHGPARKRPHLRLRRGGGAARARPPAPAERRSAGDSTTNKPQNEPCKVIREAGSPRYPFPS